MDALFSGAYDVLRTHPKEIIMQHAINLTSVSFVLLDVLLVWGCWAADKHLRVEARNDK